MLGVWLCRQWRLYRRAQYLHQNKVLSAAFDFNVWCNRLAEEFEGTAMVFAHKIK